MKIIIYVLILITMGELQTYNQKRIVVITSKTNTPEVKNQLEKFQKRPEEIMERKLAVFTLIDGEIEAVMNTSDQSLDFVKKHSSDYKESTTLKTYLIGLDKSIKNSFEGHVEPEQIFDIIDSMPMRQAEMRRQKD